jgi:hypothetical protein
VGVSSSANCIGEVANTRVVLTFGRYTTKSRTARRFRNPRCRPRTPL